MCADRADRWQPCWRLGQSDTAGSAAVHVWLTTDLAWSIVAPKQLRPLDWDAVGVPSASVPTPAAAAAAMTVTAQAEDARRSAYWAEAQRALDALATETRSVGDEILWRIHPPGQCVQHRLVTIKDVSRNSGPHPVISVRVQWSKSRHSILTVDPSQLESRFEGDQPLEDQAANIISRQGIRSWPTIQTARSEADARRPNGERAWMAGWACPQGQPDIRPADAAVCSNNRVPAGRAEQMRTVHRVCNPMIPSEPVDPRAILRVPVPGLPQTVDCLEDLFPAGVLVTQQDGAHWVQRLRSKQLTTWHMTAAETVLELHALFDLKQYDLTMQLKYHEEGRTANHRCQMGNAIIRAKWFLGGGSVIWDLRRYSLFLELHPDRTPPPGLIQQLDEGQPAGSRWDATQLRAMALAAGVTDQVGLQQCCETGFHTPNHSPRDFHLVPEGSAVHRVPHEFRATAQAEETDGILSRAYKRFFMLLPMQNQARNGAAKDGVPDRRQTANYGQHFWMSGAESINAQIDWEQLNRLWLTDPVRFASRAGVLHSSGVPIGLMRADWTRFYRQITISPADWWMSIVFADLDGPRISKSLDFGNGAGPAIAHRPMGIFIRIIHHQVGLRIAEIRAWSPDQWAASDLDGDSVLADLQTLDTWSAERRRILTAAYPTEAADATWLDFQCTSIVLDGFFDDSLIACLAALIPIVAKVLLDTAARIKLEAKTSKVWCGLPGNQTGQIDCDLWASSQEVRFLLQPGQMVGLGKLFDLDKQLLTDSPAFLDSLDASLDAIVANTTLFKGANSARDVKVCPVRLGATAMGRLYYSVTTAPQDTGLLAKPSKMMRISSAVLTTTVPSWGRRDTAGSAKTIYDFEKMFLPDDCLAKMREVASNARGPGAGIAFCPMQAAPGAEDRRVIWIMADAAGMRTRADDTPLPLCDQGGGGAWLAERTVQTGGRPSTPHPVHWRYRPWTETELTQCSTYLEGLNATETITTALDGAPNADIICVMDSASWCYAARKLRCHSPDMTDPIEAFGALLLTRPGARVYFVHHPRTDIPEADGISKTAILQESGDTGLQLASHEIQLRGFAPLTAGNRLG